MDSGMFIVTLLITIAYQVFGKDYAKFYFDFRFTAIYKAVILPMFLFYLGRVITKFVALKAPLVVLKQKSYQLLCVLTWGIHFISVVGVYYLQWNYHVAIGILYPWIFFLVGLGELMHKED